jgi:hypothetical protein
MRIASTWVPKGSLFSSVGSVDKVSRRREEIWHNLACLAVGFADIGCVLKKTGRTMEVVLDFEAGRME